MIMGKVFVSIKVDIMLYNIVCFKFGKDFYMSIWNMEIKKFKNGFFICFIDISFFYVQGLCVNEDGEILVCFYYKEDQFGKIV